MSINGGPLQTANVAFAAGQPQVLEAVAPSPQSDYSRDSRRVLRDPSTVITQPTLGSTTA